MGNCCTCAGYHEMNLDWLINQIKIAIKEWAEMQKEFTDLNSAFEDLKLYVNNYFDNLDVQDEINNKLDSMYESGELTAIIDNLFSDVISFSKNKVSGETDSQTLQKCLNIALENQKNGVNSVVTIDANITLTEPLVFNNHYDYSANIIIEGRNNSVINTQSPTSIFGNENNNYNIILSKLTFRALNDVELIRDYNVSNSLIEKCIFIGYKHVLYAPNFTQALTFKNCKFFNCNGACLYYGGAYYLRVTDCFFYNITDDYCIKQDNDISTNNSLWGNVQTVIEKCIIDRCYGFLYSSAERGLRVLNNGIEATTNIIYFERKQVNNVYRAWGVEINGNSASHASPVPDITVDAFVVINGLVGDITIENNLCTGFYVFNINNYLEFTNTVSNLHVSKNFFDALTESGRTSKPFYTAENVPENILYISRNGVYGLYNGKIGYTNGSWVRNFPDLNVISRGGNFAVTQDEGYRDITIELPYENIYPINIWFENADNTLANMFCAGVNVNENTLTVRAKPSDSNNGSASRIVIFFSNDTPSFS